MLPVRLLVVLLIAFTAACNVAEGIAEDALSAEFNGDVRIDGDAYTVTDDTGSMTVGQAVPEALVTPILNGGTVAAAVERTVDAAVSRLVEIRYPVDRYDDIMTFYEADAAAGGEETHVTTSDDFLTTTWVHRTTPTRVVEVELRTDVVRVTIAEGE